MLLFLDHFPSKNAVGMLRSTLLRAIKSLHNVSFPARRRCATMIVNFSAAILTKFLPRMSDWHRNDMLRIIGSKLKSKVGRPHDWRALYKGLEPEDLQSRSCARKLRIGSGLESGVLGNFGRFVIS